MHKKIESELVSIAHGILQMKNKGDVILLKERAKEVYEKLSVLAFVDRYLEATPTVTESKEAILTKIEKAEEIIVEETVSDLTTDVLIEKKNDEEKEEEEILVEEAISDMTTDVLIETKEEIEKEDEKILIEETVSNMEAEVVLEVKEEVVSKEKEINVAEEVKDDVEKEEKVVDEGLFSLEVEAIASKEKKTVKHTLEEELKDTISLDVATDIFENAVRVDTPKKSLNDVLVQSNIQIGLNDRIAFVKHLFEGSQEDFNRVVSQLNSFKLEKEAKKFISKMVKPDYNWTGKEEYEERFIALIERKFA